MKRIIYCTCGYGYPVPWYKTIDKAFSHLGKHHLPKCPLKPTGYIPYEARKK